MKSRSVGLILLLFVALLLPSMSMAQLKMWQGGLFNMGPTPEEMEQMAQQEEFFKERGQTVAFFFCGFRLISQKNVVAGRKQAKLGMWERFFPYLCRKL